MATGPNQVWSWGITYLKSAVRGSFYYLYMTLDVWSRKIVGFEVHEVECAKLAARMTEAACAAEGGPAGTLVLHSDNGSPMKSATMLAKLQELGVATSFSRPSVSNDNPFSESAFRTAKYRPDYPARPFDSLVEARTWARSFVRWYNQEHLHSSIRFVTPSDRHEGHEASILEARADVYEQARQSPSYPETQPSPISGRQGDFGLLDDLIHDRCRNELARETESRHIVATVFRWPAPRAGATPRGGST
jgi:putative transposase